MRNYILYIFVFIFIIIPTIQATYTIYDLETTKDLLLHLNFNNYTNDTSPDKGFYIFNNTEVSEASSVDTILWNKTINTYLTNFKFWFKTTAGTNSVFVLNFTDGTASGYKVTDGTTLALPPPVPEVAHPEHLTYTLYNTFLSNSYTQLVSNFTLWANADTNPTIWFKNFTLYNNFTDKHNTTTYTTPLYQNDPEDSTQQAFDFNGTNYITVNNSNLTLNNIKTTSTIAFWYKAADNMISTTTPGNGTVFDLGSIQLLKNDTHTLRLTSDDNDITIPIQPYISANTWTHIAFAFNNEEIDLYINGYEILTQSYNSTPQTINNYILIGTNIDNYQNYTGQLDEFLIYNTELNPTEIYTLAKGFANAGLSINFTAKTTIKVQTENNVLVYNGSNIRFDTTELENTYINVHFNNLTQIFKQTYEFYANGSAENVTLHILDTPNFVHWIKVLDQTGSPKANALVKLYYNDPTSGSTYKQTHQIYTDDEGYVKFYLQNNSHIKYGLQLNNYELYTNILDYIVEENTQETAKPLYVRNTERTNQNAYLAITGYFTNRTQNIGFYVYTDYYTNLFFSTDYTTTNYSLTNTGLSDLNMSQPLYGYYAWLLAGTHYNNTDESNDNITITIYNSENNILTELTTADITWLEPDNRSINILSEGDLGFRDNLNYINPLIFIFILVITIVSQFMFGNVTKTLGLHVFFITSIIASFINVTFIPVSTCASLYYIAQGFKKFTGVPAG